MFLTFPANAHPEMRRLLPSGAQAWRAVNLTTHMPWLILTVKAMEAEGCRCHVLVWSGDEVLSFLEGPDASDVIGLQYVQPPIWDDDTVWRIRRIQRVWTGTVSGVHRTVPIFEDDDGVFCEPVFGSAAEAVGRRLLRDLTGRSGSPVK